MFRFVTEAPTSEEMISKEQLKDEAKTKYSRLIKTFIDFIIPFQSGANPSSEGLLPIWIQDAIRNRRTRALEPEWMATIASIILLSALSGCLPSFLPLHGQEESQSAANCSVALPSKHLSLSLAKRQGTRSLA